VIIKSVHDRLREACHVLIFPPCTKNVIREMRDESQCVRSKFSDNNEIVFILSASYPSSAAAGSIMAYHANHQCGHKFCGSYKASCGQQNNPLCNHNNSRMCN